MARYYFHPCGKCKKSTSQLLSGYDNGLQVLTCQECQENNHKEPATVPKKKTTWPYYHGGCGVTFESEAHEKKYTQAHGMTKE